MTYRYLAITIALSLVVISAVASTSKQSAPLRIADIDPMSGPMAPVGRSDLAMLQYEAELINKKGGIDGHQVEVVGFDNHFSPQQSLIQLQNAIDHGFHYVAEVDGSPVASALLHGINQYNRQHPKDPVLFFSYGAQSPELQNQRCSFWQFHYDADALMKMQVLTDWIKSQKNIKKVYLLNEDYDFGHLIASSATKMLRAKRPDIKIVGSTFTPLAQSVDFTPYMAKIAQSGANVVITGDYGSDMVNVISAAAQDGVNVPFLTYYGNSPGTVKAVGKRGVGKLYIVWAWDGDYNNPKMLAREVDMYKKTGWDYFDPRAINVMESLRDAAEKAKSIKPQKVAFALEGLRWKSPSGEVVMRASDHQIQMPLYIDVLSSDVKHGAEGTPYNFRAVAKFPISASVRSTTCKMKRPSVG